MCEKGLPERIYALLLRLYPRCFRDRYGEEALQIFRDRLCDERGFIKRVRLWLDLAADIAISAPLERRNAAARVISSPGLPSSNGGPSFQILDGESLGFEALFLGFAGSIAAFGLCWVLMTHYVSYRPLNGLSGIPAAYAGAVPNTGDDADDAMLISESQFQSSLQRNVAVGQGKAAELERQSVIGAVAANVRRYYIDTRTGQKIADSLEAHEKAGEYAQATNGTGLANLLTRHMREVSSDMNLGVAYSPAILPRAGGAPSPESVARYRSAMQKENCTLRAVKMTPDLIGYLKLDSFPDPSICETAIRAAMVKVNGANALIFDLRDNRGGNPDMVALIAAYLFDHPEYWYNPRENTTERSWTRSPVPGNRLADKPVFVLTSSQTLSAAEHFSYNLKMLKRATLVGETTGGAEHAGVFHRIDDHFGVAIMEAGAINPYSVKGWEGKGVEPDVKVKPADALAVAEQLALKKTGSKPAH